MQKVTLIHVTLLSLFIDNGTKDLEKLIYLLRLLLVTIPLRYISETLLCLLHQTSMYILCWSLGNEDAE